MQNIKVFVGEVCQLGDGVVDLFDGTRSAQGLEGLKRRVHQPVVGREFGHWIGCFSLDALAACAALIYAIYGYNAFETIMLIGLVLASIANLVCFVHRQMTKHTFLALVKNLSVQD